MADFSPPKCHSFCLICILFLCFKDLSTLLYKKIVYFTAHAKPETNAKPKPLSSGSTLVFAENFSASLNCLNSNSGQPQKLKGQSFLFINGFFLLFYSISSRARREEKSLYIYSPPSSSFCSSVFALSFLPLHFCFSFCFSIWYSYAIIVALIFLRFLGYNLLSYIIH